MPDRPRPWRRAWRHLTETLLPLLLAAGLFWMGLDMARAQTAQTAQPAPATAAALYQQHCAACHGENRSGGLGPALLPESLERLRPAELKRVLAQGRPATQMPGFAEQLSAAELAALAAWVHTPVSPAPRWEDTDIRASRIEIPADPEGPAATSATADPLRGADPLNLFIVVETGDHHISVLDGDRFEVLARLPTRYALHGGPKFTPDGRFVFLGSRDGWITKVDLRRLRVVAEVRAGLNLRNIAVSSDGRWVMAANQLPRTLVLFDAELQLQRSLPAASADGSQHSRVSAVYDAAPRGSFIVALKDLPELWELPYAAGSVQPPRRTLLDEPLDDFFFDPAYRHALGATRPRQDGRPSAQVVDLDARRKVADLPIAGMPHLGSGITFEWQGRRVMASPNLAGSVLDVIDLATWQPLRTIATPGPGFFLRSHENTPYAWTDSMMSPASRDTLTIIDKRTLAVAGQVREPGRTLAHVEFSRDGRHVLASVVEDDGALLVLDAATFREVRRLPMRKPMGKYNVWNKITRSEGTSH